MKVCVSQALCVQLDDVKAAVCQLEDRGRRVMEQELQINQLSESFMFSSKQTNKQMKSLMFFQRWSFNIWSLIDWLIDWLILRRAAVGKRETAAPEGGGAKTTGGGATAERGGASSDRGGARKQTWEASCDRRRTTRERRRRGEASQTINKSVINSFNVSRKTNKHQLCVFRRKKRRKRSVWLTSITKNSIINENKVKGTNVCRCWLMTEFIVCRRRRGGRLSCRQKNWDKKKSDWR